jgi:hypothetical protein
MLQEAGAFSEQIWITPRRQHTADHKAQNANDGLYPGFDPVPLPRDQKRQKWDDNDKK